MEPAEQALWAQNQKLEELELQKQSLLLYMQEQCTGNENMCEKINRQINAVNLAIEELYSQISLLRIRKMMGFAF